VKSRGRFLAASALVLAGLVVGVVGAWDGDDWRRLDVFAMLFATTLALDWIASRTIVRGETTQAYASFTAMVLTAVLLGPTPAVIVAGATVAIDAIHCRPRFVCAVENTLSYAVTVFVAGLIADRWIDPLHGLGFVAGVALLTVGVDTANSVILFATAIGRGENTAAAAFSTYRPILPWVGVAGLAVGAAAHGYRSGGVLELGLFMLALVACQLLLVRLDAVENRLRAERDRSATYLRVVGTMVVSLDTDGRVVFVNERARLLLGDVIGEAWDDVDTGPRIVEWTTTAMPDGTVLLSGEDVTERVEAEERMARLAFLDRLTGLENRAVLDRELPYVIAHSTSAAFLLIDVDGFKRVNDVHGHATGDRVLAEAAARLRAVTQPDELLIRRGGDEFVVLARNLHAHDECAARRAAGTIAERLVRAFDQPFPVAGRIDVSVATALHPFDGPDLEHVANDALRGIKQRTLV
jgi:diguanylate cyclase (GGDEF)-like protein